MKRNNFLGNSSDANKQNEGSESWQELLPYISTELIGLIDTFYEDIKYLSPDVILWLKNNCINKEWFNHLFLIALICAPIEMSTPEKLISGINSFLNSVIPDMYPNIQCLLPAQAFKHLLFGNSFRKRKSWVRVYRRAQFHVDRYLNGLTEIARSKLNKFILPRLILDKELTKWSTKANEDAKKKRKEQIEGILNEWGELKTISSNRYVWIKLFDQKSQEIKNRVKMHELLLPVEFEMPNFDGKEGILRFRIWNPYTWIRAHSEKYNPQPYYRYRYKDQYSQDIFAQFIGEIPEYDWFLEPIMLGLIQGEGIQNPEGIKFCLDRGLPRKIFRDSTILFIKNHGISRFLHKAKHTCDGSINDSTIIFSFESLLISATLGIFSIVTFSKTAIRIGEFQQLCLDKNCLGGLYLAQFDEEKNTFENCNNPRYVWNLFPKGRKTKRESFEVDEIINGLMFEFLELHKRYLGYPIQNISPLTRFTHKSKYPGKYPFVLQWGGAQISQRDITTAISFILLNHGCVNINGEPINITAHAFRHCAATLANNAGMPLEKLMLFLHHINSDCSAYYSELPFELLIKDLIPILDSMGDEVQINPASFRNIEDVKQIIIDIMKKYGALRKIPGGKCGSYKSCKKLFLCARCQNFIPGLSEKEVNQIRNVIEILEKGAIIFEQEGKTLKAKQEREHIEEWKIVLAEIELWRKTLSLPLPDSFPFSEIQDGVEEGNPSIESDEKSPK